MSFPGLESGQISMSVAMEKLSLVAYIFITWKMCLIFQGLNFLMLLL